MSTKYQTEVVAEDEELHRWRIVGSDNYAHITFTDKMVWPEVDEWPGLEVSDPKPNVTIQLQDVWAFAEAFQGFLKRIGTRPRKPRTRKPNDATMPTPSVKERIAQAQRRRPQTDGGLLADEEFEDPNG